MAKRILVTFIIFALICVTAAADMPAERRGVVTLRYHDIDSGKVEGIFATIEDAAQDIRNELGISMREPVGIVLARGARDFEEWAGPHIPDWALAIARTAGLEGGIVIDMSRTTPFLENNLHIVLRHELVHIALGQVEREAGRRFPLWFHEGAAVRVSGGRHFTDRTPFRIAAAHGILPPLAELEGSFPRERRAAEIAYLASERFVDYLARRDAEGSLSGIINHFRESGDFRAAVLHSAGAPLEQLEEEWREGLRSRYPWLVTFWRSITLFTVISILVIIAFIIVFLRARRKKRVWQEEERMLGLDSNDDEEENIEDYPELEDGPDYYEESTR